jgi:hypothetical protein
MKAPFLRSQENIFCGISCKGVFYYSLKNDKSNSTVDLFLFLCGIYDVFGEYAHEILRQYLFIFEDHFLPSIRKMVKIGAKRVYKNNFEDYQREYPFSSSFLVEGLFSFQKYEHLYHENKIEDPSLFLKNFQFPNQEGRLFEKNRKVLSFMVDDENKILSLALNQNHQNKILHAESMMAISYFLKYSQKIPPFIRVFTSLRSCAMCAGILWDLFENPLSVKIFYLEDDLGKAAKDTIFVKGSNERRLFFKNKENIQKQLEYPIF